MYRLQRLGVLQVLYVLLLVACACAVWSERIIFTLAPLLITPDLYNRMHPIILRCQAMASGSARPQVDLRQLDPTADAQRLKVRQQRFAGPGVSAYAGVCDTVCE